MHQFGCRSAVVLAAVLGASTAFAATGAAAKPIALELKLPAKPVVPPPEMAALFTAGPIALEVRDARGGADPTVVGGQRVKGEDIYFWHATKPVVPAVQELVMHILGGWSVRLAPEADFVLSLQLARYYVDEKSEKFGSTYVADVGFKVALVDRSGTVLWAGDAAGDAKRPGVDGKASMCNEALSVALRGALAKAIASVKLEAPSPEAEAPSAATAAPAAVAVPIAIEPDVLFADLTRLKSGGVTDDVIVAYVEQRKLARPLSVDDILRWKNAGIPDAAIKAATRP